MRTKYGDDNAVTRLYKKKAEAKKSAKESQEDFAALNDSADPVLIKAWSEQEAEAQANRNHDEESMDIYDIKIEKGDLLFTPRFATTG
jgi:hypothetical protein